MRRIRLVLSALFLSLTAAFTQATAAEANYCIKYTTAGAKENLWDAQAYYTLGKPMTVGRSYTLTMKVKASQPTELAFWPVYAASTNKNQWGNSADVQYCATQNVTTEWATYTWQLKAQYPIDRLDLVFGKLDGSIWFDDIRLVDDEVGVNMVQNGSFTDSSLNGWSTNTGYLGTKFAIVDSDSDKAAPEPAEPVIPDTWPLAKQGNPNFHIFLCFGQSNMEGATQPEACDFENIPSNFKVLATVDYPKTGRKKGEWYVAAPPLCREGCGLTPSDYFGRTLAANLPTDVTIGVVNIAVGGAKIELYMEEKKDAYIAGEAQWFKNICSAYDNDPFARIIEMGKEAQKVGVIKGILIHQGESNNGESTWAGKVAKVYKRICYNLGLNPDEVPLLAGETLSKEMGGGCSWHNESAMPMLKDAIPNSYVISSEGLTGNGIDPWHFSAEGYREIGRRYGYKMFEVLYQNHNDNILH